MSIPNPDGSHIFFWTDNIHASAEEISYFNAQKLDVASIIIFADLLLSLKFINSLLLYPIPVDVSLDVTTKTSSVQ
jgi:hypothetical protein